MPATQARSEHFTSLDGLRGLAALIVVLAHTQAALVIDPVIRKPLLVALGPLTNGNGAVRLFFVLSGFVLTHSLARGGSTLGYWAKRYLRIQLPFAVALIGTWLLSFGYSSDLDRPGFMRGFAAHISPGELFSYIWWPGNAGRQLPVGWSLQVEMVFSLLLPPMIWLGRRSHLIVLIGVSLIPLALGRYGWAYSLDFALGITAYTLRRPIGEWIGRQHTGVLAAGMVASVLLWSAPKATFFGLPPSTGWYAPAHFIALGVSSVALVVLGTYWLPFVNQLTRRPVQQLGRISYSLYLMHFAILIFLSGHIGGHPTPWVVLRLYASTLAISIAVAWLGYRFVERPSIRLGHRVSDLLDRALGRERPPRAVASATLRRDG